MQTFANFCLSSSTCTSRPFSASVVARHATILGSATSFKSNTLSRGRPTKSTDLDPSVGIARVSSKLQPSIAYKLAAQRQKFEQARGIDEVNAELDALELRTKVKKSAAATRGGGGENHIAWAGEADATSSGGNYSFTPAWDSRQRRPGTAPAEEASSGIYRSLGGAQDASAAAIYGGIPLETSLRRYAVTRPEFGDAATTRSAGASHWDSPVTRPVSGSAASTRSGAGGGGVGAVGSGFAKGGAAKSDVMFSRIMGSGGAVRAGALGVPGSKTFGEGGRSGGGVDGGGGGGGFQTLPPHPHLTRTPIRQPSDNEDYDDTSTPPPPKRSFKQHVERNMLLEFVLSAEREDNKKKQARTALAGASQPPGASSPRDMERASVRPVSAHEQRRMHSRQGGEGGGEGGFPSWFDDDEDPREERPSKDRVGDNAAAGYEAEKEEKAKEEEIEGGDDLHSRAARPLGSVGSTPEADRHTADVRLKLGGGCVQFESS